MPAAPSRATPRPTSGSPTSSSRAGTGAPFGGDRAARPTIPEKTVRLGLRSRPVPSSREVSRGGRRYRSLLGRRVPLVLRRPPPAGAGRRAAGRQARGSRDLEAVPAQPVDAGGGHGAGRVSPNEVRERRALLGHGHAPRGHRPRARDRPRVRADRTDAEHPRRPPAHLAGRPAGAP